MGRLARSLGLAMIAGTVACSSSEPTGPGPETLSGLRPSCEHPAPLLGRADPKVPSFIEVFHANVDAERETAPLIQEYGFQTRYVWTAALEGFSAPLSREVVAELRCVPTVDFIEHDQLYYLD